jgi:hypothetical protein
MTDGKAEHDVPYPAWPMRAGTVVAALVVARIALTTAVMPARAAAPVQVPLAMTAVSLGWSPQTVSRYRDNMPKARTASGQANK